MTPKQITEQQMSDQAREQIIDYIKKNDKFYEFTNFSMFSNREVVNIYQSVKKEKEDKNG